MDHDIESSILQAEAGLDKDRLPVIARSNNHRIN
jgi:hypothetical protein